MLAIRYQYTEIPLKAQTMTLGPRPKPGRPAGITHALESMPVPVPKKRKAATTAEGMPDSSKKKRN